MNTDQLKQGINVQEMIVNLKKHLEELEALVPPNTTGRKDYWINEAHPLLLQYYYDGDAPLKLRAQFLNLEEFLLIYKSRVKAEIEKLEKEFESI